MDILDDMGVSKLSAKALYSLVALYFTVLLHMNILYALNNNNNCKNG